MLCLEEGDIAQAHPPTGPHGFTGAEESSTEVLPQVNSGRAPGCSECRCRSSPLTSLQTPLAKLVFSKATYHLNHLSIP